MSEIYGCAKGHNVDVPLPVPTPPGYVGARALRAAGWAFIASEGGWLCPDHYYEAQKNYALFKYRESLRGLLAAQVQYYGSETAARERSAEGHTDFLRDLLEVELERVTDQ